MSAKALPATHTLAETDREGHPSFEQMGAYHRGQLGAEQEEVIRDHFLFCRECRGLMLELVSFLDGSSPVGDSSGEEIVTAWQKLQRAAGGSR